MKRCETRLVLERTIIEDDDTKIKLPDIYVEGIITQKNYEDAKQMNIDLDSEVFHYMYVGLCKKIIKNKK